MPISAGVPSNQALLCWDMVDTLQQLEINVLHCFGRYAQLQHQPKGVPAAETLGHKQHVKQDQRQVVECSLEVHLSRFDDPSQVSWKQR